METWRFTARDCSPLACNILEGVLAWRESKNKANTRMLLDLVYQLYQPG
jgi:hypothetical protein